MCTDSISCTYVTANTIACFHSSKCKKYKNNEAPDFYIDSSYPTGHMVMRSTRQRRCAGRGRTPGTARPPPTQTHPRSAQSPAQALWLWGAAARAQHTRHAEFDGLRSTAHILL